MTLTKKEIKKIWETHLEEEGYYEEDIIKNNHSTKGLKPKKIKELINLK